MADYLDQNGTSRLWGGIKKFFFYDAATAPGLEITDTIVIGDTNDTESINGVNVPKAKRVTLSNFALWLVTVLAVATQSVKGLMSSTDKKKLDGYKINGSTASQTGFASDTYLAGSFITFPFAPTAKTKYRLTFDVTKTAAGTAAINLYIRLGTAGSTADTARLTFTFGTATAAVDSGVMRMDVEFRTVGSGTSAVIVGTATLQNNLASTGLTNVTKAKVVVSSGFDSTVANLGIGASYNGGTSAAHTIQMVSAELIAA